MKRLWVQLSFAFSLVLILSQLVTYLTLVALAYYVPTTFIDEAPFPPFSYQDALRIWVSDQLYTGATPEEIAQQFQLEQDTVDIAQLISEVQQVELANGIQPITDSSGIFIEGEEPVMEEGAFVSTVTVLGDDPTAEYVLPFYFPLALFLNTSTIQVVVQSLIIGVIAGVLTSRSLVKPLGQLIETVQAFGKQDMSQRVQVKGSQEIEELMHTFNNMADALEHAEILRSNIFADVSHELRTPLAGLQGSLRASLDHVYELDERQIARMVMQTQHLIHLVEDLRLLAQAEAHLLPLQFEFIDIPQLVQDTVNIFQFQAEESGVRLTAVLPTAPISIHADSNRLRQILHNLLSNSLRHTEQGGHIEVHVQAQTEQILFAIKDTGTGIDPEHLPHIFNRFYRTDKARSRDKGGTGLGLAITKALVEAHQGHIDVFSAGIGTGSTFRFSLPFDSTSSV